MTAPGVHPEVSSAMLTGLLAQTPRTEVAVRIVSLFILMNVYQNMFFLEKNQKYCTSVQGDCRHIPRACPESRCQTSRKINKYLTHSQCECPQGYKGNGIQCYSNG